MTNEKLGFYAAVTAAMTTAVFAVSMLVEGMLNLTFAVCILLSWAYVVLACAFATQAKQDRKALAYAGIAFACIYALLINVVYYTQLTTVRWEAASAEIVRALTYTPGTWMFAIDLLGYGIMALSTLFVGLSLAPQTTSQKVLRALLILHGLFAPMIALPIFGVFNGSGEGEDNAGVIILEFWSALFLVIMVLSAKGFNNNRNN